MSAMALERKDVRQGLPHDLGEDLEQEYARAMEAFGLPYPDSGWFKRAARLERQMREARLEAKFDEN